MTHEEIREALGEVAVAIHELQQDEGFDLQPLIDTLAEVDLALESEKPLAVVEGWLLNGDIASKKLTGLEAYSAWVYGDFYGKLPVTLTITERKPDEVPSGSEPR